MHLCLHTFEEDSINLIIYKNGKIAGNLHEEAARKNRAKKKEEKEHRKQERKQNSNGGKLEDMLAYVDENGELSSSPPEMKQQLRPTSR